jgi:hypothetical protein
MNIAYLILAHESPNHFKRLIRALASPNSACFVHVDRKSNLDDFLMREAANVHFYEDRIPVYWGEFTFVEAILRLMRHAVNASTHYDYYVHLSGTHYPVRSADYIEHFFEEHHGAEFINTDSMSSEKDKKQVPGDLHPYSGNPFWVLTREACQYILDFVDRERDIVSFYENTHFPDEMFFQTILANSHFSDKIRRSINWVPWSTSNRHPDVISDKHPAIFAKDDFPYLFVRKFADDSEKLVASIDEIAAKRDVIEASKRPESDRMLEPIVKAWSGLFLEPDFFFPGRFLASVNRPHLERYGEVYLREFYVLDTQKLVYLSVPKAACSSIKTALAKACGIVLAKKQSIHSHPGWHIQKGRLDETQSGYYKFSFVRSPFARLVSCYRQKIVFIPSPQHPIPLYEHYFFSLPTHISFADFAERVAKIPDPLADNHFKSQYALLYSEGVSQVDYVGKVEYLDNDWQQIAAKYKLDPVLEHKNDSKNKQGCHSDYRLYYTESLVQLVYERYHKDVEMFGYEEEYEQLVEFVRRQTL